MDLLKIEPSLKQLLSAKIPLNIYIIILILIFIVKMIKIIILI